MAKVNYTKLKIQKLPEVVNEIKWNEDATIEVKTYLPFDKKIDMVEDILQKSYDPQTEFYNCAMIKFYTEMGYVFNYTNINFTETQKENLKGIYDNLCASSLMDKIIGIIPDSERAVIDYLIWETQRAVTTYQNSFIGQIKGVANSFEQTGVDLANIQDALQNPENLELVKDILTKLG